MTPNKYIIHAALIAFLFGCGKKHSDFPEDAGANTDPTSTDTDAKCIVESDILPESSIGNWCHAGVQGGIPKYPEGVNVMKYDAAGNGVDDDSGAILRAIEACPEKMAVVLPAGTYYTKSTIVINKSIVLRGEGPDATTIIHDHDGRAIRIESGGDWAGVEDLHVKTVYPFDDYSGRKILIEDVQNSWIKNIETSGYIGSAIGLVSSSYCEVRDSYIHNSQEETETVNPFRAYGIEIFGKGASNNLIENNILDWFRHGMILQYLSVNNVYAYNFSWNVWTSDGGTSASTDMEFHHYDYDGDPPSQFISYTLVEGNVFEQGAFGSHKNNSGFRNKINNGGFSVHDENNLVGNEFVTKKNPGTWQGNFPRNIGENCIVHGNYFTDDLKMEWDPAIADHIIPDSYYMSAKPAWFGDLDWPSYGGDLVVQGNTNTRRNPAEVRYWTMLYPEKSPSNLKAEVSGNKVVLTWNNNSTNTVDFIICRSRDNVSYERIAYTEDTTYTDTVEEQGRYHYYIRARNHLGGRNYQEELNGIDLGGESDPSETVSLETK